MASVENLGVLCFPAPVFFFFFKESSAHINTLQLRALNNLLTCLPLSHYVLPSSLPLQRKWSDKPNISPSTEHCTVSAQSIFTHAEFSAYMQWDAQLCLTFSACELRGDSGRCVSCSSPSLHSSLSPSTSFLSSSCSRILSVS